MYLKSIELFGFKSFAKKSELTFSSNVSAIVGPNGSGKSNIAEAFRFVLGEQSIKSMRGKKGEDLIFNGAGDLPRANRASVKVVFDNSTKFLPVDFETVTIERIVYRDGINEYLINGSQVRLKDIIELLISAHIGVSRHHIISQGEADRILNATAKERKSMVEDALGLKMYQYKKQESEKKLLKTKENIAQVESLRREINPHIRFLKKQVEKVEKTLQMKEELKGRALEYCNREDYYIKKVTDDLFLKISPLQKEKTRLETELSSAKSVLEKASHRDSMSDELISLENNLHNVRKEKEDLLRESGRLDGEITSLVRMIKKQEEIANSYIHKTVALVSLESLNREIEQKINTAKQMQTVSDIISALDDISKHISNFIDSNKDKVDTSLLSEAEKDLNTLKKLKEETFQKTEEMEKREEDVAKEYTKLQEKINAEKDSNRDAEKAVFRIMAEEQEIISNLNKIRSEEETLRVIKEDFKRELTELAMMLGRGVLEYENLSFDYNEERFVQEERRKVIEKIKIRLEDAGGLGGGEVLKEYEEVTQRDAFLAKELEDLELSANSISELIVDLDKRLAVEFEEGLQKINNQFKEYFSLMFGGGEAKLFVISSPKRKSARGGSILDGEFEEELENIEEEEGEEGIDIDVSLPKKKIRGLMMLSGGERALTSIALLFAISQVNPPPFIILDETDAALDEANSRKYGDMVENLSKFSQLIVITHNRETMSRAGILYGVTMASGGGSKLLSVAFDEAIAVAK